MCTIIFLATISTTNNFIDTTWRVSFNGVAWRHFRLWQNKIMFNHILGKSVAETQWLSSRRYSSLFVRWCFKWAWHLQLEQRQGSGKHSCLQPTLEISVHAIDHSLTFYSNENNDLGVTSYTYRGNTSTVQTVSTTPGNKNLRYTI